MHDFKAPTLILLHGQMGAGKTHYVKSLYPQATSPTFNIINQYADNVFHADLYRIKDVSELYNTDFFEILNGNNIFFIEWPYNNVPKSIYESHPNVVDINL